MDKSLQLNTLPVPAGFFDESEEPNSQEAWEKFWSKVDKVEYQQDFAEHMGLQDDYMRYTLGRYEHFTITLRTGAWISFKRNRITLEVFIEAWGKDEQDEHYNWNTQK